MLLPIFQGGTRTPHSEIYRQFGSARAIRQNDWKPVRHGKAPRELYRLKQDRAGLRNLAAEYPGKVEMPGGLWEDWLASHRS